MEDQTQTSQPPQPQPAESLAQQLASSLGGNPTDKVGAPSHAAPTQETTTQQPATNQQPAQQDQQPTADPNMSTIQSMIDAAVKPYREKLEAVEKGNEKREQERRGYDAREDFIRQGYSDRYHPREILRAMLPATTDEAQLRSAANQIDKQLKGYVEGLIAHGTLQWGPKANVGGATRDGGQTPAQYAASQHADSVSQVSARANANSPVGMLAAALTKPGS